jgi:hypothetical protein
MPCILHILTGPVDDLAQEIILSQKREAGNKVQVIDLTLPEPDYKALLEKIFVSDSIACW